MNWTCQRLTNFIFRCRKVASYAKTDSARFTWSDLDRRPAVSAFLSGMLPWQRAPSRLSIPSYVSRWEPKQRRDVFRTAFDIHAWPCVTIQLLWE